MKNWKHKVQIKNLFSEKKDYKSIQKSMKQVADELKKHNCFIDFIYIDNFYKISKSDEIITPVDYANKLLDYLYDFADDNRIWIN